MRPSASASASALALVFLAGCASTPAPTAPAAQAMAAVTAPAATPATPARKNVSSKPAGYKVVERNGTTLFCTQVASLGTKFKQEVCMTQDEYDEVQRRGESVRQDLRQATKMCGGGSGVGSCNGS